MNTELEEARKDAESVNRVIAESEKGVMMKYVIATQEELLDKKINITFFNLSLYPDKKPSSNGWLSIGYKEKPND